MNDTLHNDTLRVTPRLIVGIGILTLGSLWTLDNFGLIDSGRITRFWPVILILIGAVRLLDRWSGFIGSAFLIVLGSLLLLDNLRVIDFDFEDLFPLAIAAVGGKLVWDAVGGRRRPASTDDPNSTINAVAVMAGVKRQSTSPDFRAGDATAFMGGVELDLRNAQVREGETAVIDTFAWWGGVEIRVPENWRVVGKVMPVLGGFDDKTHGGNATGPMLIVRGAAIMGAVEVKN